MNVRPWAVTIVSTVAALVSLAAAVIPIGSAVVSQRAALVRNHDTEILAWISGVLFVVAGAGTLVKQIARPLESDFGTTSNRDGYIAVGVGCLLLVLGVLLIALIVWARTA